MPTFYLSTPARKSLKFIAQNTEKKWGREQRKKYVGALNARFQALGASPETGRRCNEIRQGFYYCKEGKHIIVYTIQGSRVIIADILHENMDIPTRIKSWTQH